MKRYLKYIVGIVMVWSLASFIGVMFDTSRAEFWTQSLMIALLLGALLAPLMAFFRPSGSSDHASRRPEPSSGPSWYEGSDAYREDVSKQNAPRFDSEVQHPDFSGGSSSGGAFSEQWPYVDSKKEKAAAQSER